MIEQKIFIQYSPQLLNFLEESFLDLDFAFDISDVLFQSDLSNQDVQQNQQMIFEPFVEINSQHNINYLEEDDQNSLLTNNQIEDFTSQQISSKLKKYIAKSKKTKNICFNICQKTVKIIKNRTYNQKFVSICQKEKINPEYVISQVLKCKKNLTGPKALQMFVQTNNPTSKVFSTFMKWFLQEKYLRHAINQGTMDDLKGYLQFKNSVILNILEK